MGAKECNEGYLRHKVLASLELNEGKLMVDKAPGCWIFFYALVTTTKTYREAGRT